AARRPARARAAMYARISSAATSELGVRSHQTASLILVGIITHAEHAGPGVLRRAEPFRAAGRTARRMSAILLSNSRLSAPTPAHVVRLGNVNFRANQPPTGDP